ncbi:MAG: hypothetical protein ACK5HO_02405, partial [Pseudomonadota bacterium]
SAFLLADYPKNGRYGGTKCCSWLQVQMIWKFSERNLVAVRVSTGNPTAAVILGGCGILGPATAVLRSIAESQPIQKSEVR